MKPTTWHSVWGVSTSNTVGLRPNQSANHVTNSVPQAVRCFAPVFANFRTNTKWPVRAEASAMLRIIYQAMAKQRYRKSNIDIK